MGEEDEESALQGIFNSRSSTNLAAQSVESEYLSPTPLTEEETISLGKEVIRSFLKSRTVYEAMPKSGRVVIFDVNINLRLVLYALLEHEIRGAPLWSPSVQRLVGMVTMSDFADIYQHCYTTGEDSREILDAHTVSSWRELIASKGLGGPESKGRQCAVLINSAQRRGDLVCVAPTCSLFEAVATLRREAVHRLPVVETENHTCLQVMTLQTILEYLTTQFTEERRLFDQSIYSLGVGTFMEPQASEFMGASTWASPSQQVLSATPTTPLKQVMKMFARSRISTIPIVDISNGKVRDMYRRSFLAHLRIDEERSLLESPMQEILDRPEVSEALETVHTCTPSHTLFQVFVLLAETKAKTLAVTDDNGRLCGMCSLSDVLCYFL